MAKKISGRDDPRIEFFDRQAPTWDTSGPDPAATLERVKALEGLLDLRAGANLLEVGCGTGQLTQWLADRVRPGRVTALDFSKEMLARARLKGIGADFRLADVCRDQLGGGLYDVVLCFQCFPHFRDQAGALCNLTRSLAAGGCLIVMHLTGSEEINAFHDSIGQAVAGDHLPQGEAWDGLLLKAGLDKQKLIDREDLFFLQAARRRS